MKMPQPLFIIFFGAVIAVIGALISAYGTLLQNRSSSLKSSAQLSKIEHLTTQNAELSSKLTQASIDTYGNLTGADGYLTIGFGNEGKNLFNLTANNTTKFNIPNVNLLIQDYSQILKCDIQTISGQKRMDLDCIDAHSIRQPQHTYNINTLTIITNHNFIKMNSDYGLIRVIMNTPNNKFIVQIIYKTVSDTELYFVSRTMKQTSEGYIMVDQNLIAKELFQSIDWDKIFPIPSDFPTFKK